MPRRLRFGHNAALAALAALTLFAAPAAQAQLISPFGKSAIALEPADLDEIRAAVGSVLKSYKSGMVQKWSSSTTDRAGEAELIETFRRDGLKCGQVTHRFTAGKSGKTFTLPLCQVADGSWKLAF